MSPFQLVSRCQWLRYEQESNYVFHYIDEEMEKFHSVSRQGQKQLSSCGISEFSLYLASIGNIFLEVISSSYLVLYLLVPPLTWVSSFVYLTRYWNGILFLFHLLFSSLSQSQGSPLLEELYGISWYAAALGLSYSVFVSLRFWVFPGIEIFLFVSIFKKFYFLRLIFEISF